MKCVEGDSPTNSHLSIQMLDIQIAPKTCAGNSHYILPSRYDADAPISRATLKGVKLCRPSRSICWRAGR